MNNKIKNAVAHLNKILPLRERQKTLNTQIAEIYQAILRSFVEQGKSLRKAEILAEIAGDTGDIEDVIKTLKNNDMVIFDNDGEIIGAYPFTMEERVHKIQVNGHKVHAMCALDALAISPMFDLRTHIDSACEVSAELISIDQLNQEILSTGEHEDLHFGINWNAAENNCCATSLCTEMIFLKDKVTADSWRSHDTQHREIFTLDEAVDFSTQFFVPLVNKHR